MNDLMWSKQEKQSFINGPRFNDERLQLFSISRLRFIAFLACSSLVSCFSMLYHTELCQLWMYLKSIFEIYLTFWSTLMCKNGDRKNNDFQFWKCQANQHSQFCQIQLRWA